MLQISLPQIMKGWRDTHLMRALNRQEIADFFKGIGKKKNNVIKKKNVEEISLFAIIISHKKHSNTFPINNKG